jgi:hypothetical protein
MRVLLDENLPHELRHFFVRPHEASTVQFMGWRGIRNGDLIARAAAERFDVLVTMDRAVEHQHGVLPLALIVLEAPSNKFDVLRPMTPRILAALVRCQPGRVIRLSYQD